MNFNGGIIIGLFLFAVSAAYSGCAKHAKDLEGQQREERIVKYLDERRFDEALALAEPNPDYQVYAAEAYLGKAGFIPLEFAAQVMGVQSAAEGLVADADLQAVIPGCDAQGLASMRGVPYRCVLWRILRHVPVPDHPEFSRAREILRREFQDPKLTPSGYNALCGMVEIASLLGSLRNILLTYHRLDPEQSTDEEIRSIFAEVASFSEFAKQALRRARAVPYLNISGKLAGLEKDAFFSGQRFNLDYIEDTGIPLVIRIAQANGDGLDVIGGKIMMIQQLDSLMQKLSER